MTTISLENKRILIVDDEPDVLESLEDLLPMCTLSKATDFAKANHLLETQEFDIAILDIMGVDGYQLLETARKKKITTVMLTAHALSPDNIKKSHKGGASSYIPKEEMVNIDTFLLDVLQAEQEGKNPWTKWYERFESFCEKKFGLGWDEDDQKFWENKIYY